MANTIFTGKVYLQFDELPSTNDYAVELLAVASDANSSSSIAKSKPPEGTVVRADRQSAGRGQFGSRWESAAGQNLTLSVIYYPHWLAPADQFSLSMAVALAISDTVSFFLPGKNVCIKWPNDVYVGEKKVAGILIQNSLSGSLLQSSVVGIGLNVNQLVFHPDLPNPSSLAQEAGSQLDLRRVEDVLLEHLEQRYLQLKSAQIAYLRAQYQARLLGWQQKRIYCRLANQSLFEGVINGVAQDGRLELVTAEGPIFFDLKEIRFVLS
jgi:BirA family biotin operon repressor/biotin-[acetyl-CoA-carboxylase] ligase